MTSAVEFFRPIRAPGILASLGAAYAVLLTHGHDDDAARERIELPVPPTLQRAVPSRVRSYFAGRHCARKSLDALVDRLHLPRVPMPLEIGAFGAPVWPPGITGSITHSARFAMAAVARRDVVRSIGIDCERIMSEEVAEEVASRVIPEVHGSGRFADVIAAVSRPVFVSSVFSAKESIYKCLNPLIGSFFGFEAVALESIDVSAGRMEFRVVDALGDVASAGFPLMVRFEIDAEHVVTAVSLPVVEVEGVVG